MEVWLRVVTGFVLFPLPRFRQVGLLEAGLFARLGLLGLFARLGILETGLFARLGILGLFARL